MTNKKIGLGILALALVLGMTLAGCDNGSTTSNDVIDAKYQGTWEGDEGTITVNGNSASIAGVGSYTFEKHVTSNNGWDYYNVSSQGQSGTAGLKLNTSGTLEASGFGPYNGIYTKK